jgi:hypothetical protein
MDYMIKYILDLILEIIFSPIEDDNTILDDDLIIYDDIND